MRPTLVINRHDYTNFCMELVPSKNDLDADGSGRDVHSGLMYRNKITDKLNIEVSMVDMMEDDVARLTADLDVEYFQATIVNPKTNTKETRTFYCSSINYGAQMYARVQNKIKYVGLTFEMKER